jgi:hypothetical protein
MKRSTKKQRVSKAWHRIPENWRVITVIMLVFVSLIVAFNLLGFLLIKGVGSAIFPDLIPIQEELAKQFPDHDVGFNDMTFSGPNGSSNGKTRELTITIIGDRYVSRAETAQVQSIVCTQLGTKAEHYNRIVLQSTLEKRFLLFYSRVSKTKELDCKPNEPPTDGGWTAPVAQPENLQSPESDKGSQDNTDNPPDINEPIPGDADLTCCQLQQHSSPDSP